VLGVVLHHGIAVGMQRRSGPIERPPQLLAAPRSPFASRCDQHVDLDTARRRRCQLVKNDVVVAAEERQRDFPAGVADDVDERLPAGVDGHDKAVQTGRGHMPSRTGGSLLRDMALRFSGCGWRKLMTWVVLHYTPQPRLCSTNSAIKSISTII